MALKDKIKMPAVLAGLLSKLPKWSRVVYWRIALGGLVLFCLILAAIVFISGPRQTYHAFQDGRRLMIRLDNGDIQGKMASTDSPTSTPVAENSPAKEAAPSFLNNAANLPPAPPVEEELKLPAPLAKPDTGSPATVTPSTPLAAINNALAEKTPNGSIPAIGKDGTKPWQYYAKSYTRKGSLPMIAVVITDLGQSKSISESADKLPENFSLSFSPYAKDVGDLVKNARMSGHEVLLDLPLQPSNYPASDPGPYGLLVGKPAEENAARLQWLMERAQGYAGFVTPQNEIFSSDPEYFKTLLKSLSDRGLTLIVGHEPPKKETKQLLETQRVATVTADTLIDEELSPTAIQARLVSLEQIAKARGYAVGAATAFPLTIQQLKDWSAKMQEHGFVLVPVTFIVHLRFS
jgi:polysaccharide deacetylase 2 family uncharacterized protein YibQ